MAATGWVRYGYALVALMLVFAAGAGLLTLAATLDNPRVRTTTVTRDQEPLSASSSAADARTRYGKSSQTIDGQQIGLPAGTACDVYELTDGLTLVCYQGGTP